MPLYTLQLSVLRQWCVEMQTQFRCSLISFGDHFTSSPVILDLDHFSSTSLGFPLVKVTATRSVSLKELILFAHHHHPSGLTRVTIKQAAPSPSHFANCNCARTFDVVVALDRAPRMSLSLDIDTVQRQRRLRTNKAAKPTRRSPSSHTDNARSH